MIYKNNKKVIAIYKGDTPISKIYKGDVLVFGGGDTGLCNCFKYKSNDTTSFQCRIDGVNYTLTGTNGQWNTYIYQNKVKSFNQFMYNRDSLVEIDLSETDASDVTNINSMFYNCSNLTSIVMPVFDLVKLTSYSSAFRLCSNLSNITCNQAFKDWCLEHSTALYLPSNITWTIY